MRNYKLTHKTAKTNIKLTTTMEEIRKNGCMIKAWDQNDNEWKVDKNDYIISK